MFGGINPKVKDLTQFQNVWSKDQIFGNRLPAASNQNRISPATIWQGNGWSSGTTSIPVAYKVFTQPVVASPAYGDWRLQYSLNNAAYTDAITWSPISYSGKPIFITNSYGRFSTDNASTVDTLLSLDVRSSGNRNHIGMSFGSTTRAAWSVDTSGFVEYRAGGTNPVHNFLIGGSIGSQTLIAQIYNNGFYNSYSNFNSGKVTAGSADQSVQTTLSTYGSFAVRAVLVTAASYTLAETETVAYVDPSTANFCTGSPTTPCSFYTNSTDCGNHSGIGCSWFAGNSCSDANNTDSSTCTTGRSGCVWDQVSCETSGNNTSQETCEAQDDGGFGGSCTWRTDICPAFTNQVDCDNRAGCTSNMSGDCTAFTDTVTCSGQVGCTATVDGDCTTLSDGGGDGTNCATQPECSYDNGTGACTGSYFTACTGNYFTACEGSICEGNFNNGNCSGTYGANCTGGAGNCGLITSSGPCGSEPGCLWTTGIELKLPNSTNSLRGTTGRLYMIEHVGATGSVVVSGQTNQPIFRYNTLSLLKKGDAATLHNQNISFPCSLITSQTPCTNQSGCQWLPVVVCSAQGDQSTCEATGVCSWNSDLSQCEGTGRATAVCSGTYDNGSRWYTHNLQRGLSVVEKTANYTLTEIDDVVVATSNSFNFTLPSASLMNGKEFVMKNIGSGVITINTTSSQTIDGFASGVLTLNPGDSMTVVSNNVNWYIK